MAALQMLWASKSPTTNTAHRIERLHESVQVGSRCIALPLAQYGSLETFDQSNDAFIRVGTEVGGRAVQSAAAAAGLGVRDLDAIFFTTVTGVAAPSIDARLVNAIDLRRNIRRVPMFGLGCVGGAAGLARMADHLRGHPESAAVLLSVELCSLTLQEDFSIANIIATGLFGDGAAAVVMLGAERARRTGAWRRRPTMNGRTSPSAEARVVDSRSVLWPDTERVMGWDIGAKGFKIVLSADVPKIVAQNLGPEVDAFLESHGLRRSDVGHWICHPGGPKVVDAVESALGLDPSALAETRRSLAEVGNLSGASVLDVLSRTLGHVARGDVGVLLAMGPGFCAELVLLQW